jgi:adenylosuccinate synthase
MYLSACTKRSSSTKHSSTSLIGQQQKQKDEPDFEEMPAEVQARIVKDEQKIPVNATAFIETIKEDTGITNINTHVKAVNRRTHGPGFVFERVKD